jgi:UDP-hydrolysing UDP-N-acetyl-D-glucosamine 2-epimerase
MRKICVVTANRSDYACLKTALEEMRDNKNLELKIIAMGAHLLERYGNTVEEIKKDNFRVDKEVYMVLEGENPVTMAKSTGVALTELANIYNDLKPDIVVIPGDRYEMMGAAIAASFMNIPIAHIQGGEVTGSIDESIRHAITKLSHIHFPATELNRQRLIKMGEDAGFVFNVGCPRIDFLLREKIYSKDNLNTIQPLKPKDGRTLNFNKPFLLVIQHPVTTEYNSAFTQIQDTLTALKELNMQTIFLYPNSDAGSNDIIVGIRRFLLKNNLDNVFMYKGFSNPVFINLMAHCSCLIGNSSAGIRESCYLGTPVVNIGSRQHGRTRGSNVLDVDCNHKDIKLAVNRQIEQGKYKIEHIYGDGNAGSKIAEILSSIKIPSAQKTLTY